MVQVSRNNFGDHDKDHVHYSFLFVSSVLFHHSIFIKQHGEFSKHLEYHSFSKASHEWVSLLAPRGWLETRLD